jgi:DNA-binding MarR family transcriptional regulator
VGADAELKRCDDFSMAAGTKPVGVEQARSEKRYKPPQVQMNPEMSQSLGERQATPQPRFTQLQGQYLAFIYAYGRIFKQPPAEADMRRHFDVTAPTVHQMVLTLEKAGLITRVPGAARSIQLLVPPEALPILR